LLPGENGVGLAWGGGGGGEADNEVEYCGGACGSPPAASASRTCAAVRRRGTAQRQREQSHLLQLASNRRYLHRDPVGRAGNAMLGRRSGRRRRCSTSQRDRDCDSSSLRHARAPFKREGKNGRRGRAGRSSGGRRCRGEHRHAGAVALAVDAPVLLRRRRRRAVDSTAVTRVADDCGHGILRSAVRFAVRFSLGITTPSPGARGISRRPARRGSTAA
jgi:hypothetical protein